MTPTEPLVSVVTPVHNGGAHLAECIESVLAQTYGHWEYVIVENCSTDDSLAIAERYAARDPRIRVHRNEELLPSLKNFNHMLRQISADSRYCKVVHADDWLFPECIRSMVTLAEEHPSVGIVGSYRLVGNHVDSDGLPYDRRVFPGQEIARLNLLHGPYTFGNPSALLIRSDLIRARDPFYNEEHTGADTEACLDVLQESDFGFVHQVLSFMREHPFSVTAGNAYYGTSHPNYLYVFRKYAPRCLTEGEYRERLGELTRGYYEFLARHAGRLRDERYVAYHKQAMARAGLSFSWTRILRAAARLGITRVVDVKAHLKSAARMVGRNSRGGSNGGGE